ncbi:MAG TPA: BadF/BadG/BcrA/BcrD ATPase family protein [Candidatus Kapabacteria bacterium]|nr:BadF/BadG/BcrA/BcrD ATPase family protein [Candidatus Kapabacteria bacterium]
MLQTENYTIIGIDGGGTNTRGAIFQNKQRVVEKKISSTARVGAVGLGESCERTLQMIIDLCNEAKIDVSEVDAVVVGLAGIWLDEEKRRAEGLLRTLARTQNIQINELVVISDAEIALEGALNGEEGILLIAGTGSIALARIGKTQLFRCGGWGIELDDEGSGAWIGREGLTALVRSLDGRGEKTKLLAKLKTDKIIGQYIDEKNPRIIVKAFNERKIEYSMITKPVMECAADDDSICYNIIQNAKIHLLELPNTLSKKFKSKKIKITLLGGIFENNTFLGNELKVELEKSPKFELIEHKGTALDGAYLIGEKIIKQTMDL